MTSYGEYPPSTYATVILGTHWPQQSDTMWAAYSHALETEQQRLWWQREAQEATIKPMVGGDQSGDMIEGLNVLVDKRTVTLDNRLTAVGNAAELAEEGRAAIASLKADLYEIVMSADERLKAAQRAAGQWKMAMVLVPGSAALIEAQLQSTRAAIIAQAQVDVAAEDAKRAGQVTSAVTAFNQWQPKRLTGHGHGSPATPQTSGADGRYVDAPTNPHVHQATIQAVDYNTIDGDGPGADTRAPAKVDPSQGASGYGDVQRPETFTPHDPAKAQPASPTTAPSDRTPSLQPTQTPTTPAPSTGAPANEAPGTSGSAHEPVWQPLTQGTPTPQSQGGPTAASPAYPSEAAGIQSPLGPGAPLGPPEAAAAAGGPGLDAAQTVAESVSGGVIDAASGVIGVPAAGIEAAGTAGSTVAQAITEPLAGAQRHEVDSPADAQPPEDSQTRRGENG